MNIWKTHNRQHPILANTQQTTNTYNEQRIINDKTTNDNQQPTPNNKQQTSNNEQKQTITTDN